MNRLFLVSLVVVGALGVGIADVLMKKIAVEGSGSLSSALKNPLIIPIIVFYGLQIVLYTYVLVKKYELGVLGILQSVVYILIVVGSGVFIFKETLSFPQKIGMVFAAIGIILLNL
jgi:drug/metabolite transporter (DMT)-like permease